MKKIFKVIGMLLLIATIGMCVASCGANTPEGKAAYDYKNSATGYGENIKMTPVKEEIDSMKTTDFVASSQESDYLLIKIKNYGDIVVVLRRDIAPKTVAHIKSLVAKKFYNETVFHRVIKDFMIQGGGVTVEKEGNNETFVSKDCDTIVGEFTNNGHVNNLTHVRGVLSMARVDKQNDSASSQFFIIHQTNESSRNLNGDYASFGYVLAGMEVVDKIAACEVFGDSNSPIPVENVVIESVSFVEPK